MIIRRRNGREIKMTEKDQHLLFPDESEIAHALDSLWAEQRRRTGSYGGAHKPPQTREIDITEIRAVEPVGDSYSTQQIDDLVTEIFAARKTEVTPFENQDGGSARLYHGFLYDPNATGSKPMFREEVIKVILTGDSAILLDESLAHKELASKTDKVPKFYSASEVPVGNGAVLPVMSIEYIDGTNAEQYMKQNNLSMKEKLNIFAKMVEAMAEVHDAGYVHRDTKPSNFLLEEVTDSEGNRDVAVKVIDFGLAAKIHSPLKTNKVNGTLTYISPDHFFPKGKPNDPAVDIYSLGCILHKMLTGHVPYNHITSQESTPGSDDIPADHVEDELPMRLYKAMAAEEHTKHPAYKGIAKEHSQTLSRIVGRCLKEHPAERYDNCYELLSDVRNAIAEDLVLDAFNQDGTPVFPGSELDSNEIDPVKLEYLKDLFLNARKMTEINQELAPAAPGVRRRRRQTTTPLKPARDKTASYGIREAEGRSTMYGMGTPERQ